MALLVNNHFEIFFNWGINFICIPKDKFIVSCWKIELYLVFLSLHDKVHGGMILILRSDEILPSLNVKAFYWSMINLYAFFWNNHVLDVVGRYFDDIYSRMNGILWVLIRVCYGARLYYVGTRVNYTQILRFLLNFKCFFTFLVFDFKKFVDSLFISEVKSMNPSILASVDQF